MNDKELLHFAAKAARLDYPWYENAFGGGFRIDFGSGNWRYWNPLENDGDAFQLALNLGLTITPNYHVEQPGMGIICFTEIEDDDDYCSPTRRAIVRAAAEIGKSGR